MLERNYFFIELINFSISIKNMNSTFDLGKETLHLHKNKSSFAKRRKN